MTLIGIDAKRIVNNRTGLGSYGRTLINDLLAASSPDYHFRLYAPNEGSEDLRRQVQESPRLTYSYPEGGDPVQVSGSKSQDPVTPLPRREGSIDT